MYVDEEPVLNIRRQTNTAGLASRQSKLSLEILNRIRSQNEILGNFQDSRPQKGSEEGIHFLNGEEQAELIAQLKSASTNEAKIFDVLNTFSKKVVGQQTKNMRDGLVRIQTMVDQVEQEKGILEAENEELAFANQQLSDKVQSL